MSNAVRIRRNTFTSPIVSTGRNDDEAPFGAS